MKTFLLMNSENLYLDNDGSMTFEIGIFWKKKSLKYHLTTKIVSITTWLREDTLNTTVSGSSYLSVTWGCF